MPTIKITVPEDLHKKWRLKVAETKGKAKQTLEYLISFHDQNKGRKLL